MESRSISSQLINPEVFCRCLCTGMCDTDPLCSELTSKYALVNILYVQPELLARSKKLC